MRLALLTINILLCLTVLGHTKKNCSSVDGANSSTPRRLVLITGRAMITNFPGGALPATSETLIFQKVGCDSCYVGTRIDKDGFYKILVGDGRYQIIVRNPSSPEIDWLAPDQARFIDTENEPSNGGALNFDVKIKMPN